jgi:hypothetical protein
MQCTSAQANKFFRATPDRIARNSLMHPAPSGATFPRTHQLQKIEVISLLTLRFDRPAASGSCATVANLMHLPMVMLIAQVSASIRTPKGRHTLQKKSAFTPNATQPSRVLFGLWRRVDRSSRVNQQERKRYGNYFAFLKKGCVFFGGCQNIR